MEVRQKIFEDFRRELVKIHEGARTEFWTFGRFHTSSILDKIDSHTIGWRGRGQCTTSHKDGSWPHSCQRPVRRREGPHGRASTMDLTPSRMAQAEQMWSSETDVVRQMHHRKEYNFSCGWENRFDGLQHKRLLEDCSRGGRGQNAADPSLITFGGFFFQVIAFGDLDDRM